MLGCTPWTARADEGFPPDVADALAFIAAADVVDYVQAVERVLESFETREAYLEDLAVADTVLVLQAAGRPARDVRGAHVAAPPRLSEPWGSEVQKDAAAGSRRAMVRRPRTRLAGVAALGSAAECASGRFRLPLARDEVDEQGAGCEDGQCQRHPRDERLERRPVRRRAPVGLVERPAAREERSRVPVRPDGRSAPGRGRHPRARRRTARPPPAGAMLAADRGGLGRRSSESSSDSRDEPVVRALVVGRHAALVAPPDVHALQTGWSPAAISYAVPAVEPPESDDSRPGTAASASSSPAAAAGIVEDPDLDVGHAWSPRASSFERSIAAWIAFRNAARTPALLELADRRDRRPAR